MAEANNDIQDTGQLVARASRLVGELRQTMDRVAQSASDEGPQVQLEEWSAPSEEPPAAEDAPPADEDVLETDEEELAHAEESEPDVPEELDTDPVSEALVTTEASAEPEALAETEAPAEPEALAQPEAPAELEPSESATSEMEAPQSAESDDATEQTEALAEDEPESAEQPSILVSAGESEQTTLPPDEADLGTDEDAVINSDEESADSGSEAEAADATTESEGEPEMVMAEERVEAPSVESELLVDATAEAGDTAEARERVRSLDSELARLADSMIEGGVDDEHSVLIEDAADPMPVEAESESADTVPARAPEVASAPPSTRLDLVAAADDPGGGVLYHLRRAAAAAWRRLERLLPTLVGEFGPTAHVVCECASGPVNKRSPVVRRAVGWVAIVTAMYAAAVLVYVGILRKPPTIDGENTGMSLVPGSDEVVAAHRDD